MLLRIKSKNFHGDAFDVNSSVEAEFVLSIARCNQSSTLTSDLESTRDGFQDENVNTNYHKNYNNITNVPGLGTSTGFCAFAFVPFQ